MNSEFAGKNPILKTSEFESARIISCDNGQVHCIVDEYSEFCEELVLRLRLGHSMVSKASKND